MTALKPRAGSGGVRGGADSTKEPTKIPNPLPAFKIAQKRKADAVEQADRAAGNDDTTFGEEDLTPNAQVLGRNFAAGQNAACVRYHHRGDALPQR